MAYHSLLLVALLFVATTTPSDGLIINKIQIAQVNIVGRVYCTLTGNPDINSPGIAGVNMVLICNGGRTTVAQVLTDTSGFFDFVLEAIDGVLFDPSLCIIRVRLPVASCSLLPTTGTLDVVPRFIDVVGGIAKFTIGTFVHVV